MLCNFLVMFPLTDKSKLTKWLVGIKRDQWKPKTTDYICPFEDSYFLKYSSQIRPKDDAVPTVFRRNAKQCISLYVIVVCVCVCVCVCMPRL